MKVTYVLVRMKCGHYGWRTGWPRRICPECAGLSFSEQDMVWFPDGGSSVSPAIGLDAWWEL